MPKCLRALGKCRASRGFWHPQHWLPTGTLNILLTKSVWKTQKPNLGRAPLTLKLRGCCTSPKICRHRAPLTSPMKLPSAFGRSSKKTRAELLCCVQRLGQWKWFPKRCVTLLRQKVSQWTSWFRTNSPSKNCCVDSEVKKIPCLSVPWASGKAWTLRATRCPWL